MNWLLKKFGSVPPICALAVCGVEVLFVHVTVSPGWMLTVCGTKPPLVIETWKPPPPVLIGVGVGVAVAGVPPPPEEMTTVPVNVGLVFDRYGTVPAAGNVCVKVPPA